MSERGLVEITCNVVSDNPARAAIAVTDGTTEPVPGDDTGRTRDKWFWIPRSHIKDCEPPLDTLPRQGLCLVKLKIPEWKAEQEGLI